MTYRLTWMNDWSTYQKHSDPRVLIMYAVQGDEWIRHTYHLYFDEADDAAARRYARAFIANQHQTIDVFSLVNREQRTTIMTEATVYGNGATR